MRWPRRVTVPDDARAVLDLAPGERVVAAATTVDGESLVATGDRLLLAAPGVLRWARSWSDVTSAHWDADDESLAVDWLALPPSRFRLAPGTGPALPEAVRERVESSVVATARVDVRGRGQARLVVRRAGGGLVLQVVPGPGTDLGEPSVAAAVEAARRELVDRVGARDSDFGRP